MKIPKYMYKPVSGFNRNGIDIVRKALEIEATLYRKGGQHEAARALLNSAKMLKRVSSDGLSFAAAFDFPVTTTGVEGRLDTPTPEKPDV